MSSSTGSISIMMPTYNGAAYLPAALRSLEDQGAGILGIIVVDDGSTDSTREIAGSFASRLPIRVIERPRAGNWVANTNLALRESRGEFVALLHQDDLWYPGRAAAFRKALDAYPKLDVFLNSSRFVGEDGSDLGPWRCPLPSRTLVGPDTVFPRLYVQNFIAILAPIARRSLVERFPLDERLWYFADWKLWLSLAANGRWLYVDEPFTAFRVHPHSITASSPVSDDYRAQFASVLGDFASTLQTVAPERAPRWTALAQFSAQMNLALAEAYFGAKPPWLRLFAASLRLGPFRMVEYLRYSRLLERVGSRLSLFRRARAALLRERRAAA